MNKPPLIIVRILGGLGNQMFQYALGSVLAERLGGTLKLDTTLFRNYEFHSYSLDKLALPPVLIATDEEIARFAKYPRLYERMPLLLKRVQRKCGIESYLYRLCKYYREKNVRYQPEIVDITGDAYLDGYWQTARYFENARPRLLREFTPKAPLGPVGQRFAEMISRAEHPVCVHIRRGDFANHPTSIKAHGTCSLEYYHTAVARIREKVSNPQFFVFSDSIEWAQENFIIDAPTEYLGQGPDKNHEDVTLMRYCRHFILSNSTFGWWGAWLSEGADKIVIAPNRWMNKSFDITDLIPAGWITLDS